MNRLAKILFLLAVYFVIPRCLSAVQVATTVAQLPGHCSSASIETIARYYRTEDPHLSQKYLGLVDNARIAKHHDRRKDLTQVQHLSQRYLHLMHNARIAEHFDRKETGNRAEQDHHFMAGYQPILAEMLIDRGYVTISTRTSITEDGRSIYRRVVEILVEHLQAGHWAVLHVPGHYMAITAYDRKTQTIYFNDPRRPEKAFSVALKDFINPKKSWHTTPEGKPRPGWDGRVLIFWPPGTDEERALNIKDRCPACKEYFHKTSYTYCRRCRTFIDRREDNHVQRGLDLIALSTVGFDQTRVSHARMLRLRNGLKKGEFIPDASWREAMINYPLAHKDSKRIVTLRGIVNDSGVALPSISIQELERIIASGEKWLTLLELWQSRHGVELSPKK